MVDALPTSMYADILGIELPTELRLVKSAFRKKALLYHPDRGGDPKAFRDIEQAYRELIKHSEILKSIGSPIKATVNGKLLTDLGKGYPINVSAKTCENCEGRGYRILHKPRFVKCNSCHGDGWKRLKCKRCNGTKKYRKNGRVVGDCYACNGTGEFVPHEYSVKRGMRPRRVSIFDTMMGTRIWPKNHYCDTCDGEGRYLKEDGQACAIECDECKGIGEIKLFNPVLPRGLITRGVQ